MQGFKNHPYIPNSNPAVQEEMLREIGLSSLEQLHAEVPEEIKLKKELNLPEAIISEYDLKKEIDGILKENVSCADVTSFLGGGCWPHFIPAICDEINSRGEFLTAYGGESYNDFGRFQTLFEYQSLVGELVDMDVVNVPTMDWGQAAATSIRMASRITGRKEVLVAGTMSPERFAIVANYTKPDITLKKVPYYSETGLMDTAALKTMVSEKTACVYFENPSYLGFLETQGQEIADLVHGVGGLMVVGVDPISLGVVAAPPQYGADIVCGDLQPLGVHMNYGGGQSGFMATRDEEKFVMEFPSRLFGICPTSEPGEYGFGDVAYDRTSFGHHREHGKEYVGTQSALWGITAGVYLSLMGPDGMEEVGNTIMQKNAYAIAQLSQIQGVNPARFTADGFKEFVVDFTKTGKTVSQINEKLREKGIFGGKDLSKEFPELGQCALYCVTEIHSKAEIDSLCAALRAIV